MIVLQILGLLLKLLGIALLVILLLLLLLLLAVLFVPVRYRAELKRSAGGELHIRAKVSYLLNAVRIPIRFENGKLDYSVKVLCFTLFPKKGGSKEKKKRKRKGAGSADTAEETAGKPADGAQTGAPEEGESSGAAEKPADDAVRTGTTQDAGSDGSGVAALGEPPDEDRKPDSTGADSMSGSAGGDEENTADEKNIFYRLAAPFRALRRLWQKLLGILQQLRQFVRGLGDFFRSLAEKREQLSGKTGLVREFLLDEVNKNAFRCAGGTIFGLLKYILPYKMEGEIIFGTGNAYSMGQALSMLGIIYPLYAKNLTVRADFETECFRLEACVKLKGRVRMGRLLYMAVRLWFRGKLKQVLKNVKKLKEDLTAPARGKQHEAAAGRSEKDMEV